MNEIFYLKIQGKANIPERLAIGHNYKIVANCSITQEQRDDNENGEFNVTFKAEPITMEISQDNGKVIKAKDPRKNSMKMRNYLFKLYADEGYIEEFDKVYDMFTNEVMAITPHLLRQAIKRLQ